ncbi:MAG: four helix bundle protein, partial [Elusimicrobia bacterium]|nr:four helix bundle protein [Elusimicrobiota bacterium]
MIQDFKDLVVWQKAVVLVKEIYKLTKTFPPEEQFGLTSQIRRAAISVSSNIAEGHSRKGREFPHFLSIARGSLAEVESQLLIAVELNYISSTDAIKLRDLASEIYRMMGALSKKLTPRPSPLTP